MSRDRAATALLVAGYPVSIAVILRWLPVVRERRLAWFAAHEAAVAAIVAGWAIKGDTPSVLINSSWLATAAVWYAVGGTKHA